MGERNPMALWPGYQFQQDKKLIVLRNQETRGPRYRLKDQILWSLYTNMLLWTCFLQGFLCKGSFILSNVYMLCETQTYTDIKYPKKIRWMHLMKTKRTTETAPFRTCTLSFLVVVRLVIPVILEHQKDCPITVSHPRNNKQSQNLPQLASLCTCRNQSTKRPQHSQTSIKILFCQFRI